MKYSTEVVGKVIAEERAKRKMTQAKLGEEIGVTGKQISNYEKGNPVPPIDALLNLCEVFDCELGYLLGEPSYAQGSTLETQINKLTGLSKESMNNLRRITGTEKNCLSFGHESEDYRKILNAMFSSDCFMSLIEAFFTLDYYYKEYHGAFQNLRNEIGDERYENAYAHSEGSIDYEYDPDAPKLSHEEANNVLLFKQAIEKQIEAGDAVEFAQYKLIKAFQYLIDEMYPSRGN